MYQRALDRKEKVLGRDYTSILGTISNLGIINSNYPNRYGNGVGYSAAYIFVESGDPRGDASGFLYF